MRNYVVGFMFDDITERVLLIRKEKPLWQKGLLNGVGGKMEQGETPFQSMRREFKEEATIDVEHWEHFATLKGKDPHGQGNAKEDLEYTIYFFRSFLPNDTEPETATEEKLEWHSYNVLPYDVLPNLNYLVPLAYWSHSKNPILLGEN